MTEKDEVAWAGWMDTKFSSLMFFHQTYFLERGNLPMGDTDPGEAVMS